MKRSGIFALSSDQIISPYCRATQSPLKSHTTFTLSLRPAQILKHASNITFGKWQLEYTIMGQTFKMRARTSEDNGLVPRVLMINQGFSPLNATSAWAKYPNI
jgi:hypothetical protein